MLFRLKTLCFVFVSSRITLLENQYETCEGAYKLLKRYAKCQQLRNALQGESSNASRGSGVGGRQGLGGDMGGSPGGSSGSRGSHNTRGGGSHSSRGGYFKVLCFYIYYYIYTNINNFVIYV